MSSSSGFKVQTCDGKEFVMTEGEARLCGLLWSAFQDFGSDVVIPMPSVTSAIFEQILYFIRVGYGNEMACIRKMVGDLNGQVKELIMACQYLRVTELNEFLSTYIRDKIQEAAKTGKLETDLHLTSTLSKPERLSVQEKLETNKL